MPGSRFGARTLARSQALQLLFQAEATGRLVSDVLAGDYVLDFEALVSEDEGSAAAWPLDPYGELLAKGADGMLHELDRAIDEAAVNWTVGRMPSVDRNLLRLAVYEMSRVPDVALSISINEFVELAKAYGTDESSRFVNGVLGRVATRIAAGEDVLAARAPEGDATSETAEEGAPEPSSAVADAPGETAGDAEAATELDAEAEPPRASSLDENAVADEPAEAGMDAVSEKPAEIGVDAVANEPAETGLAGDVETAPIPADDDLPEWARG